MNELIFMVPLFMYGGITDITEQFPPVQFNSLQECELRLPFTKFYIESLDLPYGWEFLNVYCGTQKEIEDLIISMNPQGELL